MSKNAPRRLVERIKTLMEGKALSQAALAKKSGVDRSQLNRFLKHGRTLTTQQLAWIAKALDVELDDLGADVPDEARRVMQEFDAAIERAVAAEAENVHLKEQMRETTDALAEARREVAAAHESCGAKVAEARVRADEDHQKVLDIERARAAKETEAAVAAERERSARTIARLQQDAAKLAAKLDASSKAAAHANALMTKWVQHARSLETQLKKKSNDMVGVGVLAALGGLMVADRSRRR